MERLGYLGPEGTFTNEAAIEFISGQSISLIPYEDIQSLMLAIANEEEEAGIVPIENSLEGSVNITLDLLAHKVDLKIIAEVLMPINHNLIGQRKANLSQVTQVLSHPQALAQCRDNLNKILDKFKLINTSSTAEAVQTISDKDSNWAAIGSKLVARLNKLKVLESNIQDNELNWTRFIVLNKKERRKVNDAKTSLICSPLTDRPGILYEILKEFAQRDINLTKIESRPARKMLGDYIFFIDFEGGQHKKRVRETLTILDNKTSFIKILGSYPKFKY
ncbi:prephenate dehydratase [Selenihalanaerobacter shriftii]|uniref:Prephenate dehydratase n=1 Tax=Selenihalanaerobacter shriftii TaxID=142842 RepID=A0A1T4MY63_9FIRM|nr:prephenate dehydratase [Selenihalanaerobacter shriftii]SJZ71933.1 prephenate dehydratase [Selenihalanaerobacter shriftii]